MYANRIQEGGNRGMDTVMWEDFFRNMDLLAQGIDENGDPVYVDSDGNRWCGILLFSLGDLEQLCIKYGLKCYNDADEICGWCDANRTTRQYTNLLENSEWRPSEDMSNHVFAMSSLAAQRTTCLKVF